MIQEAPVTQDEKEKILRTAIGLILEPDSWTAGTWKCPAIDMKTRQQREDANGKPLFQYCVHGAMNQATYDVLGEERAIELGAINPHADDDRRFNGGASKWGFPADWLGVEAIAAEEYGEEAMAFNDTGHDDDEEESLSPQERLTHHQKVLGLLRRRLGQFTGGAE